MPKIFSSDNYIAFAFDGNISNIELDDIIEFEMKFKHANSEKMYNVKIKSKIREIELNTNKEPVIIYINYVT